MEYAPLPRRAQGDTNETERYILEELERLAGILRADQHYTVQLDKLHVAPTKPRDGMIILADGTDFNPGSGAGYYGWRDGAWRFLG